jgi:hypothetical protein
MTVRDKPSALCAVRTASGRLALKLIDAGKRNAGLQKEGNIQTWKERSLSFF